MYDDTFHNQLAFFCVVVIIIVQVERPLILYALNINAPALISIIIIQWVKYSSTVTHVASFILRSPESKIIVWNKPKIEFN